MTDTWFHATPDGGRNGPMRADDLVRLFQVGRIHAATPVWREGMTDWAPLSSVAATLGLPAMPPPVPRAALPPPRRGLHWIWIVLIALIVLAIPVIAILAAIALPAYDDYRTRAGVAEVVAASVPVRLATEATVADGGFCFTAVTSTGTGPGLPPPEGLREALQALGAHRHVDDVHTIEDGAMDTCRIEVVLGGFDRVQVDGIRISWTLDQTTGRWTCSGQMPPRLLPEACRS
ncbi:MAG: GYF domain-containing protein [Luteimonas sp.]